MEKKFKFSIVTVCYNAIDSIEDTILSVINQTYPYIEYIIIDGGSTDGTIEVIKKFSSKIAHWISEPDNGIYDAMNKAILKASGDYINFMNSGDKFVDNNVLSNICQQIPDDASLDIVYGNTYKFNSNKKWEDISHSPNVLKHHGAFCHQSAFIKTNYHKQHLFDLKYKFLADFDFFHQAYMSGASFHKIDLFIAEYNAEFGASLSHINQNYRELEEIVKDTDTTLKYIYRRVRQILGQVVRSFKWKRLE